MLTILHRHTGSVLLETELLQGADLSFCILQDADLDRTILLCTNLAGGNLINASLVQANLSGADLTGADLWGADVRAANLALASLRFAHLDQANFRDANHQGANLRHARLERTDLRQAWLVGADLSETDLSSCLLEGALFDENTQWPEGFQSHAAGAYLVSPVIPRPSVNTTASDYCGVLVDITRDSGGTAPVMPHQDAVRGRPRVLGNPVCGLAQAGPHRRPSATG